MADNVGQGVFPVTINQNIHAYGFYAFTAGTITGKDALNETFTDFPVAAGSYHPWEFSNITAMSNGMVLWGVKRPY